MHGKIWGMANTISRLGRLILNEALEPLGLSSAEGNVLLLLLEEGDMVRQEDLVEGLDISKPAVSRVIDSLEKKGLVIRERDLADKRAFLIALTPLAKACLGELHSIYENTALVVEKGLSHDDVMGVVSVLQQVITNLTSYRAQQKSTVHHETI